MVGGNLKATIQEKTTSQNEIGESVAIWTDKFVLTGWLDLSSGTSSRQEHNTKTEKSTHVFICDYRSDVRGIDITQCRFVCESRIYELKYIDDPMELHDHLEITLKLVGVSNGL